MESKRVFVIVLAAGRASRFGAAKQLARYRGEPLVQRAVGAATEASGKRTLLVLGHVWHDVLDACAPAPGFFVLNERYADGLATSIARAVRVVERVADAVVITLCDQPCVTAHDLTRLIAAWQEMPERIVCAAHESYRGPPALFPRRYFSELVSLDGDRGARALLDRHDDRVIRVSCEAATIDVDTPADLASLDATIR